MGQIVEMILQIGGDTKTYHPGICVQTVVQELDQRGQYDERASLF